MTFRQKLKLRKLSKIKSIMLYGVFFKKESDSDSEDTSKVSNPSPAYLMQHYDIITVVPTYKDAHQALDKLVYFAHFDHFALWCQSHNYADSCSALSPAWEQYKRDVIGKDDYKEEIKKFSVFTLTYTREDLAGIIRVLSKCRPLLLPTESPIELQNYLSHQCNPETNTTAIPMYLIKLMGLDVVDGPKLTSLLTKYAPPQDDPFADEEDTTIK